MRVYIAYKFKNNKDKVTLKENLENIAKLIEGWGDTTFVLGRDVKKWQHVNLGSFKLIPVIFKNMSKCDIVYAYVDSEAYSKGLFFELVIAKLLHKKSLVFVMPNLKIPTIRFLATKTIDIKSIQDITRLE